MTTTDTKAMEATAALRALAAARGDAVVLTTMMVSRGWAGVSTRPELDLPLGSGFRRAETFDDLAGLERALPELLAAEGPTFVTLKLRPFSWGDGPRRRTIDAVRDLTDALTK